MKKRAKELIIQINEERTARAKQSGWNEIQNRKPVWDEFYARYDFKPSVYAKDWPAISEPTPSRTFNVGHYYNMPSGGHPEAVGELGDFYVRSFRNILTKDERVIALDWQHPCYTFDPFFDFNDWLIPAFPNGDYYIFMTPDLSGGFFGHPWEQTICVIGEKFVAELANAPEMLVRNPIRQDGESI